MPIQIATYLVLLDVSNDTNVAQKLNFCLTHPIQKPTSIQK